MAISVNLNFDCVRILFLLRSRFLSACFLSLSVGRRRRRRYTQSVSLGEWPTETEHIRLTTVLLNFGGSLHGAVFHGVGTLLLGQVRPTIRWRPEALRQTCGRPK